MVLGVVFQRVARIHESGGRAEGESIPQNERGISMTKCKNIMIYVLELENCKYYVGYSLLHTHRIQQHFEGNGSSWTKLHKPIRIVELIEGDKDTERETTLRYMRLYGWENVRGGGYTAIQLHKPHRL